VPPKKEGEREKEGKREIEIKRERETYTHLHTRAGNQMHPVLAEFALIPEE
jgi:hypothetical protein